ncbi:SDR family oxidoreductase [Azospirillum halopraeferens]|uniref:SDR family oxidoreductase n=1 Tax=Azospirillum halopraeferens TaxID=34010 RepID=UPI0004087596|nr:SDR family oxidoreductase [Azospirillum halopraeferens]
MGVDVVTGGAGFIGSHLVDALLALGRTVRIVDNFASGHPRNLEHLRGNDRVSLVEGDVADRATMDRAISGAERVFHLAALADIVPSIQRPDAYYHANVHGTFTMLEASRAAGVGRIVYVASSSCYGIPDVYPTPETSPRDPRYPYALTKWMGEEMALHWAQVYDLPVVSVRFFNIYGPRARTTGAYGAVFGVFLAQLLAGKPLTVVGDGEQSRDFTYVSDAAESLIAAAERGRPGEVYNVGSGRPVTINEVVRLLGAGEVVHIPKRPGEPDMTFADIAKIGEQVGWTPRVSIEEGVARMLENIEYWRDAPVWTPEKISQATADWFRYLTPRG